MFLANYHTHSLFCDGAEPPESYVLSAIGQGMQALGFSAHSPLPLENNYGIKSNCLDDYRNTIRNLQQKYFDRLQVFLSVEFDFVPFVSDDISEIKKTLKTDYVIASVHLVRNKENNELWFIDGPENNYISGLNKVFGGNIRKGVEAYFEQIQTMAIALKPDIIGHFDKIKMNNKNRYFTQDENWYRAIVEKTLDVISLSGSIIEVNTRGIYKKRSESLFPEEWVLKEIFKRNISVTLSSDAHLPSEICAYYPEAISILKETGFKYIKVFDRGKWRNERIL